MSEISIFSVDDESLVRQLLKRSVDWKGLGVRFSGEADDAESALAEIACMDRAPDILFADICMPVTDGIHLSEELKRRYPHMKIVILTGHGDLQSARRSIKAGVSEFLLKPIQPDEVIETVVRLKSEILAERADRIREKEIHQAYIRSSPLMAENLLASYIKKDVDHDQFIRDISLYHHKIISPHGFGGEARQELKVGLLLCRKETDSDRKDIGRLERENIVALEEESTEEMESWILICDSENSSAADLISEGRTERIWGKGEFLIAAEGAYGLDQLPSLCGRLRRASRNYPLFDWDGTLSLTRMESVAPPALESEPYGLLEKYIRAGLERESIDLIARIAISSVMDEKESRTFRSGLAEIRELLGRAAAGGTYAGELDWDGIGNVPELRIFLAEHMERIISPGRQPENGLVCKVRTYLKENLDSPDLSQESTARACNVCAGYLSRKFKQETGKTFSDYLAGLRIARATELIRHTDLLNYEIAEKIGIDDPHYFSIFFKKHMGFSIREYRRRLKS